MDNKKKGNFVGILGTILANGALLGILLLISFTTPDDMEDGGVPVIMGEVSQSQYNYDPKTMVDVEVMETPQEAEALPSENTEQELITQQEEETIVVEEKKEIPKKEIPKKEAPKKVVPEKTEAERLAEAKKLAEEKAERERKAAAEAAAKRVSGAFGKGSQLEANKGTGNSGSGMEGSQQGNSTTGEKNGSGGYGTFNLGGRSIGEGGLPRPVYNVQDEGRVVVNITVNPAGVVVNASINLKETNTSNSSLRKAALDAAQKARFNVVTGLNNQAGTITYNFKLR